MGQPAREFPAITLVEDISDLLSPVYGSPSNFDLLMNQVGDPSFFWEPIESVVPLVPRTQVLIMEKYNRLVSDRVKYRLFLTEKSKLESAPKRKSVGFCNTAETFSGTPVT